MTAIPSLTIADVKMWAFFPANIGHIVLSGDKNHYTAVACGGWGNVYRGHSPEMPKRICKRCRAALTSGKLKRTRA